ncbi:hypothetical protein K1719_043641 [Acacia pycnantha]|nr:hypothetical protein K1719_043641 [Acacia pycnantha]
MGGANAQGRSLDKRIRSRIAFFVESSTSEKKCLAEAKKRLTHFIRLANDLRSRNNKNHHLALSFLRSIKGAEIARTECGKYGKTSRNVFNQKIDYASAEVSTRYGISGVKVWISYSKKKGGRAISETFEI